MKKIAFFTAACSILLTACKKDPPTVIPKSKGTPVVKGTPIDSAITKTIGPNGGSFTSADNGLTVVIPAGAVKTNTEFSIQPITNTAPNGIGTSYILLPEGQHFDKPVSIQFKYTEAQIEGTYPQSLFIAFQDTSGIWNATGIPQVDTVNKTVTITSQHFSRWAQFANTILFVDKPSIDIGEIARLSVREVMKKTSTDKDDELLAPLYKPGEYIPLDPPTSEENASDWSLLTKQGDLMPNGNTATYKAPGFIPSPNPVTIQVTVTNLLSPLTYFPSITLLRKIYVGSSYFEIILDGNTNIYPNAVAYTSSGYINISGSNTLGNGGSFEFLGTGAGTYNFGGLQLNGVNVNLKVGGLILKDFYIDCSSNPHQLSGTLTITSWSAVGNYVEGNFAGDVVTQSTSCGGQIKAVSGRFKAKRMT